MTKNRRFFRLLKPHLSLSHNHLINIPSIVCLERPMHSTLDSRACIKYLHPMGSGTDTSSQKTYHFRDHSIFECKRTDLLWKYTDSVTPRDRRKGICFLQRQFPYYITEATGNKKHIYHSVRCLEKLIGEWKSRNIPLGSAHCYPIVYEGIPFVTCQSQPGYGQIISHGSRVSGRFFAPNVRNNFG